MMYPYMTLADETEIVHSHILTDGDIQKVEVYFERPRDGGFDFARCRLPDYAWLESDGFSDEEMKFFDEMMHSNAHLFYKYAASGGIKIA